MDNIPIRALLRRAYQNTLAAFCAAQTRCDTLQTDPPQLSLRLQPLGDRSLGETPQYHNPEQVASRHEITHRTAVMTTEVLAEAYEALPQEAQAQLDCYQVIFSVRDSHSLEVAHICVWKVCVCAVLACVCVCVFVPSILCFQL